MYNLNNFFSSKSYFSHFHMIDLTLLADYVYYYCCYCYCCYLN